MQGVPFTLAPTPPPVPTLTHTHQQLSKCKGFLSFLRHPGDIFIMSLLCPAPSWPPVLPVPRQGLQVLKGHSPPTCADLGPHFLQISSSSSLMKAVFASPPAFLAITLIKLIFLCSLFCNLHKWQIYI